MSNVSKSVQDRLSVSMSHEHSMAVLGVTLLLIHALIVLPVLARLVV